MKDLTKGSIPLHILSMSAPVALSMLVHIAYQIITLHFVSRIGTEAVAGVSAAGNVLFAVAAAMQVVTVGTASLIAHCAGRKDLRSMEMLGNQSLSLSVLCMVITLVVLLLFVPPSLSSMFPDAAVAEAATRYTYWVALGYALLFPMVMLSAVLRGAGIVRAPAVIYTATVIIDAALAFILIPGYGPVPAMGVAGAGLATTGSVVIGVVATWIYFRRSMPEINIRRSLLLPDLASWRRLLAIGLPAGAEMGLMFLSTIVVYIAIRNQEAAVQAGFGIGWRVLQTILLPAFAVAFAAAPLAGQNYGAGDATRVRQTFRSAALIGSAAMVLLTLLVQWQPAALVSMFDTDASTALAAQWFLEVMSWTFVAQALVYTCAHILQGLGNTVPALASAGIRFVVFAVPTFWISQQPEFRAEQVWYLLTGSVAIQALLSLVLLHLEFERKLDKRTSGL